MPYVSQSNKGNKGFTILELLVVIAIIGILSVLSVVSYTKIQANTRDHQRSSKVTVLAESLEKYFDLNGEYPSCTAMSAASATISSTTLKGMDPNILAVPTATSGTNSILPSCADLTTAKDSIAYVGDGSATCSVQDCLQWTIKYLQESTGTIATITSRHKTNVITSGGITDLTASAISFTQLNLAWTAVSNATGYTLQRSTDTGFVGNLVATSIPSNTTTVTGLSSGTKYFFRVVPTFVSGSSYWSNTEDATMMDLATTTAVATINSFTQITVSWNAITYAQSYSVDQSTSSTFATFTTTSGIGSTSYAFTGLTSGTTYYYRVRSTASGFYSDYSNTASATALILPAQTLSVAVNSTRQVTLSWNALAMAQSYTVNISTSSSFTSPSVYSGLTTTSSAFSVNPGTIYYFRIQGVAYGNNGTWSNTATATTPISAPAAPSISAWMSGATAYGQAGAVSCDGGTPYYEVAYNLNDGGTNWPGWAGSTTAFNINEDNKAGFWSYAYCQGPNVASASAGGNYAATIRGIDTPAAPNISAWMSGTTAVGATSGVGCAAGTANYQVPYNVNDGGTNWPGYWAGSAAYVGANQGYKYGFWSYAYCQGTYTASASSGGNYAYTIRGIDTPPTPCYQGPGSFWNKSYAVVNYGCASCPAGTGGGNFTFRSQDWYGGQWGPHPWGYNDEWDTLATDQYVYYWGHYTCGTAYTYTWSAESYTPVLAHHY